EEAVIRSILRGKDILDLFDTTADVAGHDLDISPYIRDGGDTDVEVFWREIGEKESPPPDTPQPAREESCRVPVYPCNHFLKRRKRRCLIWRWHPDTNEWELARTVAPGKTLPDAPDHGVYTTVLGGTANPKTNDPMLPDT